MTLRYEPHRFTGGRQLAATCDAPGCDEATYAEGTPSLARLGWRVTGAPSGDVQVPVRCPVHAEER